MKRFLIITFAVVVWSAGAVALLIRWYKQSCIDNTNYSERYSEQAFARIRLDMPRATVIDSLGAPVRTITITSYPAWALRHGAGDRYGKHSDIAVEFAMFSAQKDSGRNWHRLQVIFGPEGTVLDTANYLTD